MRHVAEKLNLSLEDLYNEVGWPLFKKYGHAYDAFKLIVTYVIVMPVFFLVILYYYLVRRKPFSTV